ncbi:MAG: cyclohexanecarboxylate-CoA ligase [Acetobacteraceae bacterium]|nr:cyclohexanecarboxylate-CoA ligase [Acetobacteraceae bacterium]
MEFDAVLLPRRRDAMIAQGLWQDRTINDYLGTCLANCPDKLALTAYRLESGQSRRFTYRELATMADRIAIGLARLGIARGDIVGCQLPNWWQFTLIYLACSRIGAVMNPLMHIFRERELSFMLAHGEVKLLVVPKLFRGFDYEKMAQDLQPSLPHLQHLVVVDGDGENSFDALLSGPHWEDAPDAAAILSANRPGPDDVTQLLYTSGTTGQPKAVMHSANTVISNIVPYAERLHLTGQDVVLMASPMSHQTGFMYGLIMPIMLQGRAVLQDIWQPAQAVEIIRTEHASFTMASTPFLSDLTQAVEAAGQTVPSLRTFLCAGAPIPTPLVERARRVLGIKIISAWGMTENGAVTLTRPEDDDERSFNTDGLPLRGVELKVVDINGHSLPHGEVGKLMLRSCSNFGGYLKRPHLNETDDQDWFDTGDMARLDAQGYVRITGRSKDVIIRGGENVPVVEIESLLYRHPAIAQVAIVGYPDARLGERACAFVVLKPEHSLDLPGLVDYMKGQKVALQYIPERLELLTAMPATASGKIQKFRVRELLQQTLAGGGA